MNQKEKDIIKKGELLASQILIEDIVRKLSKKKENPKKYGSSKVYLEMWDLETIVSLLDDYHQILTKESMDFALKQNQEEVKG